MSDLKVLREIATERERQDEKWGQQDHPRRAPWLETAAGSTELVAAYEHEVPTANRARTMVGIAVDNKELSWAHILVEEVSEFVEASTPVDARAELVQIAAVAMAAIASLDRNGR